ncbi:ComEC/Rec2 family competence protein [Chryseobacterium sp. RU33C]|uniref:ComEC/Rec2 family competence protein n=1 Tax=Chryseobacterium sp. RU33C TaxID=1907398 RepID=UPI000956ACF7|nr:MBL fold metallo-hydrolase [Chryseobacterium sp. RU33C]SIQ06413.1 Metal-dependent hydrolase, beta-lactamase superfamily II [Chryseobacterium sp. RU33C]
MKITFKDVGQGDSIIIEWNDEGVNKVGIIDCKKKGNSNPVVKHLEEKKYSEIEFIILSHPHLDHYSGFLELFEYIESNYITVNLFGNTLKDIGPGYWEWFEVSPEDSRILADIVRKSEVLSNSGLLKKHFYVSEFVRLPIKGIEMHALSPSHLEIKAYQNDVQFDAIINKKQASKAANYLSSLFYIKKGDSLILLTSDVEKITFDRIYSEGSLNDHLFCLCQAPHHGSYNNYHDNFWNNLKTVDGKNVVFSSGMNEKYKHPHLITVKSFANNGYRINPTNIVYGIQEFLDEIDNKTLILDTISEIDEESITGGDKIFTF